MCFSESPGEPSNAHKLQSTETVTTRSQAGRVPEYTLAMQSQANITRCDWAKIPLAVAYHDEEWGVPSHDDRHLFEHIVLEGAQAGLSWELILRKRDSYRKAFAGFDIDCVAEFDDKTIEALANDPSIIRNRQKIRSAVNNARAAVEVRGEYGTLSAFLWDLVGQTTVQNSWTKLSSIPARTAESERVSRELVKRGFSFVGPVGMYSFMQAVGMVNDHLVSCYRYGEISQLSMR